MVLRTSIRSLLLFVALLSAGTSTVSNAETCRVRVLLEFFSLGQALVFSGDGLQYQQAGQSWTAAPGASLTISPGQDLTRTLTGCSSPVVLRCALGPITIAQGQKTRTYRGQIVVNIAGSSIALVNDAGLEEYLRGVVPCEMPVSFPLEALKAQAVAARSFALANIGKHSASAADLCDSDHCQVYGGAGREKPASDDAISQTSGQVLAVLGKVISAQYSSSCGGHTSPSGPLGASCAVLDADSAGAAYCAGDPNRTWQCRATQAQILSAAGERRTTPLRRLSVVDRDVSGRVRRIRLTHDFGESELSANALSLALGLSRMKSLLCSFAADPVTGDILVNGSGWGHGVGLCQWGARGMALAPQSASYRDILGHYYRPATLGALAPRDSLAATTAPSTKTPPSP